MWLRKEIQQICIKDFELRQQLDILQDNAYIQFNLRNLVLLSLPSGSAVEGKWSYVAPRCNSYWYNIVGYIRYCFPKIYDILDQKEFLRFTPIVLRKENLSIILQERIFSIKSFIEIGRSITYFGSLREPQSRSVINQELFKLLSERCKYSDPPGSKLIHLGNRIQFIRYWLEKLILKNQSNYTISCWEPVPIFPKTEHRNSAITSPITEASFSSGEAIPVVSDSKPNYHFSKIQLKTVRLSDIFQGNDSDSTSSSDSVWEPPFKKQDRKSWPVYPRL